MCISWFLMNISYMYNVWNQVIYVQLSSDKEQIITLFEKSVHRNVTVLY